MLHHYPPAISKRHIKFFVFPKARNFPAMSRLSSFSVVGDSNVRRHLSSSNTRGRAPMATAQYIPSGGRLSVLASALESVRPESDACVIASVTNLLTTAAAASTIALRVETIIMSFFEKICNFAVSRSSLSLFICPPMYRTTPLWYRDGLPEINHLFAHCFKETPRPPNVRILPGFSCINLEADGVHLLPASGLEYVLYLFEAPEELMKNLAADLPTQVSSLACTTRTLEDRVTYLEQDHARLRRSVEFEAAEKAELLDLHENVRCESFFMIQGLPRLGKMDSSKEWHDKAKSDVSKIIEDLGFSFPVKYVLNSTGRGKDSKVLYKVCMYSAEASRNIRDKFGSFFTGGNDSRPASLSGISIRNCVTTATLARVAILQLLGKRYKESNPGSKAQVITYEPRPVLRLTPPPDASDRRIQSYNFVEAVTKLPTHFSQDEIDGLLKRISPRLYGSLKSTLVVINDDMVKKSRKKPAGTKSTSLNRSSGSDSQGQTPDGQRGRKRGSGRSPQGPSAKR